MKAALLLIVALFLTAAPARAESFCRAGTAIYDEAEMCEDNYLFVRAADECVEKLNQEVAAATQGLNGRLVHNDGQNQSLNFDSALRDYGMSSDTLAKLIADNQQALADVKAYYPQVIEPEDMDEVDDVAEWGKSVPCYFRTRKSIVHVADVLETKLYNLKAAKAVADAHDGISSRREANVGEIAEGGKVPTKGTGQGRGKGVPAGQSRNPASSITGVEESKKKEAEGQ